MIIDLILGIFSIRKIRTRIIGEAFTEDHGLPKLFLLQNDEYKNPWKRIEKALKELFVYFEAYATSAISYQDW